MFPLKAAILSSVYVALDTGASSAAELCLAAFSGFVCLRPFSLSSYEFVVFWYLEA